MSRTAVILTAIPMACAFLCVLVSCRTTDTGGQMTVQTAGQTVGQSRPQNRSGRELFFSDSLNALARSRPYPVPNVEYTPAPKGYKPVYISSYARHGSRKPNGMAEVEPSIHVLSCADSLGCLTPLGKEVLGKLRIVADDIRNSLGDITLKGVQQHRGIAERMGRNYPDIFSRKGTSVRLYSTEAQRTMMSMFACNEGLLKSYPKIRSMRQASKSLTFLEGKYDGPPKVGGSSTRFIADYFDPQPVLDRLFTGYVPELEDTVGFINRLYTCGMYAPGLDVPDVGFVWDLFTMEELFILQQAISFHSYAFWSNAPLFGDYALPAIRPLLKDFRDKADVALERRVPGADLRFGHDFYLMQLLALIGVNGYVSQEDDPLKVVDTFQDFIAAPMAGNLQMVFYRNKAGDVLVKFLQNEVESWIPIDTDMYPYYHWNYVRDYFNSLID